MPLKTNTQHLSNPPHQPTTSTHSNPNKRKRTPRQLHLPQTRPTTNRRSHLTTQTHRHQHTNSTGPHTLQQANHQLQLLNLHQPHKQNPNPTKHPMQNLNNQDPHPQQKQPNTPLQPNQTPLHHQAPNPTNTTRPPQTRPPQHKNLTTTQPLPTTLEHLGHGKAILSGTQSKSRNPANLNSGDTFSTNRRI